MNSHRLSKSGVPYAWTIIAVFVAVASLTASNLQGEYRYLPNIDPEFDSLSFGWPITYATRDPEISDEMMWTEEEVNWSWVWFAYNGQPFFSFSTSLLVVDVSLCLLFVITTGCCTEAFCRKHSQSMRFSLGTMLALTATVASVVALYFPNQSTLSFMDLVTTWIMLLRNFVLAIFWFGVFGWVANRFAIKDNSQVTSARST